MGEKNLSDRDLTIANIIASQGDKFADASVIEQRQNPFALPKELEDKYTDRYDFRWVSKDPRMLDKAMVKGWKIANRIHLPGLSDHLFSLHGGIEKIGTVGHILAFRPKALGDAYRKKNQAQSNENIKKALKTEERDKKDSPFYTAKLSPQEEANESGYMVQGKDF